MSDSGKLRFDDVDGSGDSDRHAATLAVLADALGGLRARTVAQLGLRPGIAILDAGCGIGELVIELAPRLSPGGRIVGIDASRELLDRASAAAVSAGVDVEFQLADIRDLPFAANQFDVVRSERVLQHLEPADAPLAATELIRVAKPGGIVQLVDPNHRQSTLDATDRGTAGLLIDRFSGYARNPESGLHLGWWMRSAGGADVTVDVWPLKITTLEAFRATRALDRELADLVACGALGADRAAEFLDDLILRDQQGAFLATVISYVVTARKP